MDARTESETSAEMFPPFTYVLTQLEVYNWGAFEGRHSADIDLEGTAIIGPTGSGKTTLVDALMTLLTANPRYNLASTGGHESDRDLVSYVRGVSGAGNDSGNNEHIVRPGKTVTGISARFGNGERELCIAAVFWFDDTSGGAVDLHRLWIFSEVPSQGLMDWLTLRQSGGARALKQAARETPGLHITPNKQEYLAHLRRFFEVGENAFTLLNRAAGLKQLNSIDEIFRELVLEDSSAFDRAAEVANEFANLTAIHEELKLARQQQLSLKPIADGWQQHQELTQQWQQNRGLQRIISLWFAEHGYRLWKEKATELGSQVSEQEQIIAGINARIAALTSQCDELRDRYFKIGGSNIEGIRAQIKLQAESVDSKNHHSRDYRRLTAILKLSEDLSAESLQQNQERAREAVEQETPALEEYKQEMMRAGATEQIHQTELKAIERELQQVESRPSSNIPSSLQEFRSDLAEHLQLSEEELPYIAELLEVKRDESRWRGAIERAIGSQRLRILVSPASMNRALSWVNKRDNRVHVRLLEVDQSVVAPEFFPDGFTRKLNFKRHSFENAVRALLAGLDRHCVSRTEDLHRTPFSMTDMGLMSGKSGFFDKQDQRPLDRDWMTGFDNKDRIAELSTHLADAKKELTGARAQRELAQSRFERLQQRLAQLKLLQDVRFSEIDLPGAQAALDALNSRLLAMTKPESDVQTAHANWQEAQSRVDGARDEERAAIAAKSRFEKDQESATDSKNAAFAQLGGGMSEAERSLAAVHLVTPDSQQLKSLPDLEREAAGQVRDAIEVLNSKISECQADLVRAMERAQKVDTGALAEAGTETRDVPAYLERLRVLTEEALPEKLNRFLNYLNQSSDQGVTQLLTDISNEVSAIEERIEDLNRTLRRVDFQPERYLQLEPQRIEHESLKELQQAQRHLRSAALKDDQGESHFQALENMVALLRDASERRKTVGARALLDPRYRLQFAVSTIDRGNGAVIERRTSSQGGSGGEKESIASYVLTASLSYALCPQGSNRPLFGTIVLDEAFSKSSQSVAGRIISALHEFGLHALFVTPNKELRLLRQHTRSAILIHRKGQRATMTSLSWDEIEAHARERKTQQHEVSG